MRTMTRALGIVATPGARIAHAVSGASTLTVIGWHRVGDAPDGLTTSRSDFCGQLDVIEEWGGTVLPLLEAQRLLARGELPERAVVLTFDDGYASVLEVAWPELKRRGMPGTLFAVSGYLCRDKTFPWDTGQDRHLTRLATRQELCDVADDGFDIGSHTVTHRWLPGLSPDQVAEEVTRSRAQLEDLLGREVLSFAYPMGGWTPSIRDQVEAAGYEVAITVDRGRNPVGHDPLALRRAFAFDRPEDVRRQLDGGFTWMRLRERSRSRKPPRW
ncbi:peptidoglycan/xylan/chitin deacetylase (PgdA/CDA1 family) [Nocardioides daedukensis]|uniref:Peptidoglycan/xylan/chitin deacetylase (PgdA/CDA1 family) n=1 Tax=Nocardioides daedukensis TaxID=634462 RepID=A0A7Y9S1Q0_9ACTN|nr:polysaccharide deacetylase family protein [Nocardioides daedukensis]NYG58553.1 peptidoglycan/xylan/chitin deacetylase (PgdA/CDA1 family) [Nocardioides daedukensis]